MLTRNVLCYQLMKPASIWFHFNGCTDYKAMTDSVLTKFQRQSCFLHHHGGVSSSVWVANCHSWSLNFLKLPKRLCLWSLSDRRLCYVNIYYIKSSCLNYFVNIFWEREMVALDPSPKSREFRARSKFHWFRHWVDINRQYPKYSLIV